MKRLLIKAFLGHFRAHPWQALLSVVGVALGVAVFVSIEGANGSALRAFELSAETITGRTTHQIVGASTGVPAEFYRRLRVELGLRSSAPVVEGFVQSEDQTGEPLQLRLLGVDPFAEGSFRQQVAIGPGSRLDLGSFLTDSGFAASTGLAERLGLQFGDRLAVRAAGATHELVLAGTFDTPDDFERQASADLLLADISTAQTLLALEDRLSRIDLILAPGTVELDSVMAILPMGTEVVRPERRSEAAEQMTRAFRLNLRALSLLALLCGAFLIYNTMTFAVLQRRSVLGVLRALGVTARELFALVLIEAACIGALGATLGVLLGAFLARYLIGSVTRTINDLYFSLSVGQVTVPPSLLGTGIGLGVGVALLAALRPANEALRTRPRLTLDRIEVESSSQRMTPLVSGVGVLLAVLGSVALELPVAGLATSFLGLFLILTGLACLTPLATLALTAALTPLAGNIFGSLGRISARGVVRNSSRTSVAIAALMMSVAVTVGVDVMIRSFRDTVDRWLEYSLPADLYLTSPSVAANRFSAQPPTLDRKQVERLAGLAGVERVNTVRSLRANSNLGSIRLLAHDLDRRGEDAIRFQRGDPVTAWRAYRSGKAVLVSEPFAYRHGLELGSVMTLDSPSGPRDLPIAGVFFDYATEEGTVMLSSALFRELWLDQSVTAAALYLEPDSGIEAEAVSRAALAALGTNRDYVIRSNGLLRTQSLEIFDRTFVVTGVLRLLAILVAFVGILAALMALQLERKRELAVLRALGLTPKELWTMVTAQTGLLGLIAGLLALPVGTVMALIMVRVINKRAFGWSLDFGLSPAPLVSALFLALAAALLAGLYPAYRMARTPPAEALRSE